MGKKDLLLPALWFFMEHFFIGFIWKPIEDHPVNHVDPVGEYGCRRAQLRPLSYITGRGKTVPLFYSTWGGLSFSAKFEFRQDLPR
jgi:hypothetical protein